MYLYLPKAKITLRAIARLTAKITGDSKSIRVIVVAPFKLPDKKLITILKKG